MRRIIRYKQIVKEQFLDKDSEYFLSPYILFHKIDDGILIKNVLTNEILLYDSIEDFYNDYPYLVASWFFFKKGLDIKSFCDGIFLEKRDTTQLYKNYILEPNKYVIFTTLDCNARCDYCYEKGAPHISMNETTSLATAKYIANHYNGKQDLKIMWFGGEPLVNPKCIDIITTYLTDNNIPFISSFTTNGYLLGNYSDYKLLYKWNMIGAQITLDGTENNYLKIKNFVNKDKNAFQIVLSNIERLLKLGINVSIRINVSIENTEDIKILVQQLIDKFRYYLIEEKRLDIYCSPLFEGLGNPPLELSEQQRMEISNCIIDIYEYMLGLGIDKRKEISMPYNRAYHCFADEPNTLTINPLGNFVCCEHHYNTNVGNVFKGVKNLDYKKFWFESARNHDRCATCFNYPVCRNSTNCPTEYYKCDDGSLKFEHYRHLIDIENSYITWRNIHEQKNFCIDGQ